MERFHFLAIPSMEEGDESILIHDDRSEILTSQMVDGSNPR